MSSFAIQLPAYCKANIHFDVAKAPSEAEAFFARVYVNGSKYWEKTLKEGNRWDVSVMFPSDSEIKVAFESAENSGGIELYFGTKQADDGSTTTTWTQRNTERIWRTWIHSSVPRRMLKSMDPLTLDELQAEVDNGWEPIRPMTDEYEGGERIRTQGRGKSLLMSEQSSYTSKKREPRRGLPAWQMSTR